MDDIVEVCLTKNLRDARYPPEDACALAYTKALEVGAEEIRITQPGGWQTTYTVAQVRAFLMRFPQQWGLVRMGETLGMDEVQKCRYRQQQFYKTRGLFLPA